MGLAVGFVFGFDHPEEIKLTVNNQNRVYVYCELHWRCCFRKCVARGSSARRANVQIGAAESSRAAAHAMRRRSFPE